MGPAWVTLLLLLAAGEKGRLCVGGPEAVLTEGQCTEPVARSRITVTPSGTERLFVWLSENGESVYTGVIPANATAPVLDPHRDSVVELSLDGDPARGWPTATTIAVRGTRTWQWLLPANDAARLRRIHVPRARYRLWVKAERHQPFSRPAVEAIVPRVPLGELRLAPLPVLRGKVVDGDGHPLAGAAVSFEDGTSCTDADEQGAFACELAMGDGPAHQALVVFARGYGPKVVAIPAYTLRDYDYGAISLVEGRYATLRIMRPNPGPATLSLYRDSRPRQARSLLRTVALKEREEVRHFDLEEGTYLIRIRGTGPLEQLELPLEVGEQGADRTIEIEPYELHGTLRFGDDPVAEGRVEIFPAHETWREPIPVQNGSFTAKLWQRGRLSAFATGTGMDGEQELVESPELGADPSRWDIRIEKRMLAGRVYDAVTGKPVKTHIEIAAAFPSGNKIHSIWTKSDGTYRMLAPESGTFHLSIHHHQYAPVEAETSIGAGERVKTFDIALEAGVAQPIELVTPGGVPVSDVSMFTHLADRGHPSFGTAITVHERFAVRGRPGETLLLYFLPRHGSFAVARLVMPRQDDHVRPRQIVISPPAASLRVRIVEPDGRPAPGAALLVRYDGEFVPRPFLRLVTGAVEPRPDGELVLPRLPAGAYELWAMRSGDEEAALVAGNGSLRPPVRVGLSGGESSVTVAVPRP